MILLGTIISISSVFFFTATTTETSGEGNNEFAKLRNDLIFNKNIITKKDIKNNANAAEYCKTPKTDKENFYLNDSTADENKKEQSENSILNSSENIEADKKNNETADNILDNERPSVSNEITKNRNEINNSIVIVEEKAKEKTDEETEEETEEKKLVDSSSEEMLIADNQNTKVQIQDSNTKNNSGKKPKAVPVENWPEKDFGKPLRNI